METTLADAEYGTELPIPSTHPESEMSLSRRCSSSVHRYAALSTGILDVHENACAREITQGLVVRPALSGQVWQLGYMYSTSYVQELTSEPRLVDPL